MPAEAKDDVVTPQHTGGPPPAAAPRTPPANILLVDDDVRNLTALETILDLPEYRLVRAQTAEEALKAIIAEDFALLVLDVRMPRVDGFELAQMIKQRKKTRHLPIIFLSAYYQGEEHALLGYDAGAVDYLAKPLNPAVLRSKVAAFVGMYRMNRALQDEIAERRQAERRLAERTAEVQELVIQLRALAMELTQAEQRERKQLAGILHDHLQQLIASALLQIAAIGQRPGDKALAESLATIESTLQDAIAVSRSVTVELSPPVLHEAGLAAGLEWFAERLRAKHRFNVIIKADPTAEPESEEERFLLYECTRELLFNAVKHSGANEATVSIERTEDNRILISVGDRGNGFDTESPARRKSSHTSFGLFSVQQRLAHLGGAMEIHSAPGKGTRIDVTSPPVQSRKLERFGGNDEVTDSPADSEPAARGDRIKILIADDQAVIRQAIGGLLNRESDVTVVGEASSGAEALERTLALQPDIVLMDVDLGESSGIDATREILARKPGTKVVGLSVHRENDIAAAMCRAGAVAYLTKDVDARELLSVIRTSCRPA